MAALPTNQENSNKNNLKAAKKKMKTFVKSKNMFAQFVYKGLITDEQSLRFLGLGESN